MASPPTEHDRLLPARRVCERYDVTDRTLDRWLGREALAFPRPLRISGRRYWYERELVTWERAQLSQRGALRDQ